MVQIAQNITKVIKSDQFGLRQMRLADVFTMNNLFMQSIDDSFTYFPVSFKRRLRREHNIPRLVKAYFSPKAVFLLLSNNGSDVGYCLVRTQANRANLLWMFVSPGCRGKHAGEKLLLAALDGARQRDLDAVELVTHDKEDFYSRYGFVAKKRVAGLVGGVDMTIMEHSF
jgi:ribosomal protein S18 acetylase RimI-like enzyme